MASLARYYRTLGLPITASAKEIKAAYIELCKKCHPDVLKSTNSSEVEANKVKFQEIQDAYSQLINKDGSKNEDPISRTSSAASAYEQAARQAAGFPNNFDTYRDFYHENPYIHRQYKKRSNPEGGFDFESYYKKKYGQEYENYKKWSSNSGQGPFSTGSDDEFWNTREWNEYRKMVNKRRMEYRRQNLIQLRVAMICVAVFFASNLLMLNFAQPQNPPSRTRYW